MPGRTFAVLISGSSATAVHRMIIEPAMTLDSNWPMRMAIMDGLETLRFRETAR